MNKTKLIRWGWIAIALLAAWLLRGLLAYALSILMGGTLLALLVNPACVRLERHMPRPAAIACVWLLVLAILAGLAAAMAPSVAAQARRLCQLWPQWCLQLQRLAPQLFSGEWGAADVSGMLSRFFGAFRQVTDGVGRLAGVLSRLGMMWILSVFLLLDRERYALKAELLIPCRYRRCVIAVAGRIGRELSLFLRGQLLVGLCVGALSAAGLFLIGLDDALLLGILVGIFNLIPYFGPVLGSIPAVLSAWSGGWVRALLSVAVLVLVQQVDGMWISPGIMSSVTGLSPLTVLLSMAVGGAALGVPGLLLAIPAAIALRIIGREVVQHSHYYKS